MDGPTKYDLMPLRSEQVSDQTASGIITRLHYPGYTRIVKRARRPEDDNGLRHEYTTLMLLNIDNDAPRQIPRIFHELPAPMGGVNRYAFEMEDIPGKSLTSGVGPKRLIDTLPAWKRIDALDEAVKGLSFANKKGILHRDVQLANIMYDPDEMKGKVIDWVLADRRQATNQMSDVVQFREVAESSIAGIERVPTKIEQWIYDVGKSKFSTPEGAWDSFRRAVLHFNTEEDK